MSVTSVNRAEYKLLNLTLHSNYYDKDAMDKIVSADDYVIGSITGGYTKEISNLLFNYLMNNFDLNAYHRIFDIGCGDLRIGMKLLSHLVKGHYFGLDLLQCLVDKGIENAINNGLEDKIERHHFAVNNNFNYSFLTNERMNCCEFALAISVFTYLPMSMVKIFLRQLGDCMEVGGKVLITFFQNTTGETGPITQVGSKITTTTFPDRAPYHYKLNELARCFKKPWYPHYIGNWGHPGNEKLIILKFWPFGPQ
jgi:SAM-dependent methyltransferase